MSTAIVCAYIPAGFVIGADGRRIDPDSGSIVTETAQKIFSVKLGKLRLIYAWSGSIVNFKMDGTVFDFKVATDLILTAIDLSQTRTFSEFVTQFANALYILILSSIGVRGFKKEEIARVLFVSYFNGQPHMAKIYIKHDGQKILRPEVEYSLESVRIHVFTGSEKAYQVFGRQLEPTLLQDASKMVRDYIKLCFIHRDLPLDGENPIGGHIHIGQLTTDRFSWVYPPIPD